MTQPCPICGGIGEHYAPCGEVGRWSGFDVALQRDGTAFTRITREGGKLVYTPLSAAEFYAVDADSTTPTGDQS